MPCKCSWTTVKPADRWAILATQDGKGWDAEAQAILMPKMHTPDKVARGLYAYSSGYSAWVLMKVNVNLDQALNDAGIAQRGLGRGQWVGICSEPDARGYYFVVYGAHTLKALIAAVSHSLGGVL